MPKNEEERLFSWSATSSLRDSFQIVKNVTGQEHFSAKALRSWFDRQLTLSRVDKDIRELFMGHAVKGVSSFYEKFTPNELEGVYKSAYPKLRFLS